MTLFVQDPEGLKRVIRSSITFGNGFGASRALLRDVAATRVNSAPAEYSAVVDSIVSMVLGAITPEVLDSGESWLVHYLNTLPAAASRHSDLGSFSLNNSTYWINGIPNADVGYVELGLTQVRRRVTVVDPRAAAGQDPIQALLGEDFDYATNVVGGQTFIQYRPRAELLEGLNPLTVSMATSTVAMGGSVSPQGPGLAELTLNPVELTMLDADFEAPLNYEASSENENLRSLDANAILTQAKAHARAELVARIRGRNRMDPKVVAEEERKRLHRIASSERFQKHRNAGKMEDKVIPALPFLGHGFASSRRWGIEIESGGARGVTAPPKWDRKRDGSLRSAWDGFVEVQNFEPFDEEETTVVPWRSCPLEMRHMPHVETYDYTLGDYIYTMREDYLPVQDCERCGTITRMVHRTPQTITHRRSDDDCAEFVSPILTSMHSNGLEAILAEVSKQPQNDSAGVHVHVEASDLSQAELSTLVYGYDMLERFVEASYQRTRRDYCERRDAHSVLNAARGVKAGASVDVGQRYLTLNLQSLSRHGTVEFRAMGPVYDYDYLVRWAMFCREMVNIAKAGVKVAEFGRVKKWEDVLSLFVKYGKEFVRAVAFEAGQKVAEVEPLAKPEVDATFEAGPVFDAPIDPLEAGVVVSPGLPYPTVDMSSIDMSVLANAFSTLRVNMPRVEVEREWLQQAIARQVQYNSGILASV